MERKDLSNKTNEELIDIIMDLDDQMKGLSIINSGNASAITRERERNKKLSEVICVVCTMLIIMMIACFMLLIR